MRPREDADGLRDMRIGVDVGGTHTDAVIVDANVELLAKAKVPTSPQVSDGIAAAIEQVLAHVGSARERVGRAMLGTTHATNAVLERRNLDRVAVVRIGAPLTQAAPPLATWPLQLREVVSAGEAIVGGGVELDGRPLAPLDVEALRRFLGGLDGTVDGIAIASVFSPVAPEQEIAAAEVVRAELGPVHVSLSHEIGAIGLLERENATVLNATLVRAAAEVAGAFDAALRQQGMEPEAFFAQNDGTLMALDYALRFPVLTIGSGPANSMRGAAHMSGEPDAVVIDVGGTTTDVGVLVNGFPRESGRPAVLAGVQTNFRMPDLRTLALGGGSVVEDGADPAQVGPHSVGYRLAEEALVFGGTTATLTDAAVAARRGRLGSRAVPAGARRALAAGLAVLDAAVADAVDRVKAGPARTPVVAVGGGSFLLPDRLPGVSRLTRPADYDVANAIGAAIAPVSGQADRICPNRPDRRRVAIDDACDAAFARAVEAGADPAAVEVVEVEEIPLTYLVDPAVRIRVRAAGPLA
jgi:N-methylhydantoinase A/oxoprolinase/acetone carboxylase beta subunit